MKTPYEYGYFARVRGCKRVLCNPESDDELRDWQRGWDAANRRACPQCQSRHISADGDFDSESETYWAWWICEECSHKWRYQDEKLNP